MGEGRSSIRRSVGVGVGVGVGVVFNCVSFVWVRERKR